LNRCVCDNVVVGVVDVNNTCILACQNGFPYNGITGQCECNTEWTGFSGTLCETDDSAALVAAPENLRVRAIMGSIGIIFTYMVLGMASLLVEVTSPFTRIGLRKGWLK
jgi:hypothetical protein